MYFVVCNIGMVTLLVSPSCWYFGIRRDGRNVANSDG